MCIIILWNKEKDKMLPIKLKHNLNFKMHSEIADIKMWNMYISESMKNRQSCLRWGKIVNKQRNDKPIMINKT